MNSCVEPRLLVAAILRKTKRNPVGFETNGETQWGQKLSDSTVTRKDA